MGEGSIAIPPFRKTNQFGKEKSTMNLGGILVGIFLLLLGILLVSGILNFLLWIIGIACIVLGIGVGLFAIFSKKDRY